MILSLVSMLDEGRRKIMVGSGRGREKGLGEKESGFETEYEQFEGRSLYH